MTEATTWPKAEIKAILEIPWVGDQRSRQDQLPDDIVAQKLMAIMRVLGTSSPVDGQQSQPALRAPSSTDHVPGFHHPGETNSTQNAHAVFGNSLQNFDPSIGQQAQPATVEEVANFIIERRHTQSHDMAYARALSITEAFDVRKKL